MTFRPRELAEKCAILENTVVVDCDRHEINAIAIRVIPRHSQHVIEKPDLSRTELAVSREPAFGKNPLSYALARDELNVLLENTMIERLTIFAPDEYDPNDLKMYSRGKARAHSPTAYEIATFPEST